MDMKTTLRRGLLCLLLSVLAGCSTLGETFLSANTHKLEPPFGWISPWGMPVSDDTNAKNIEFGQLDTDMNYYYSDSPTLPPAVIKLGKDYAMDDVQWKPITDPETLHEVVQAIRKMDGTNGAKNFRSFTVKAPDTRPIGTWYSNRYVYGMRLKFSANRQFSLSVPNYLNNHTYYVKRDRDNRLSQGMATLPKTHSAYETLADAPL